MFVLLFLPALLTAASNSRIEETIGTGKQLYALERSTRGIPVNDTAIDSTIYSLPHFQDFDQATPPNLPTGWSFIAEPAGETPFVRVVADANSPSPPNCVRMQGSNDTSGHILLIAPPLALGIPVTSTSVSFWAQLFPFPLPNCISVGVMTDPDDPSSYVEIQSILVSEADWMQHEVPFHSYQGTGRYIAFKHPQQWENQSIRLDSIQIESLGDHDLAATGLSGEQYPMVGDTYEYSVTLSNFGLQAQDNYRIVLQRESGIELAWVPGPSIAPNQSISVNVPWIPDTLGILQLTAWIDYPADGIPGNNISEALRLNVQDIGISAVIIGEGDLQARIPFDMYRHNSLFETIYQAHELEHRGWITGMELYNDFSSETTMHKHATIWLGETQQTDLIQGWINATELSLVYDGITCFPPGQNVIYIEFDNPFLYQGSNLVILTHRPLDSEYHSSSDYFRCQDGSVFRSRGVASDTVAYDPHMPPLAAQIQLSGIYPKSTFLINSTNLGCIQGSVTDNQNLPIAGAVITADSQQTMTDSAGSYLLLLPPGVYDVTVSAPLHLPVTELAIAVLDGQDTILDFILDPLSVDDPELPPLKPTITRILPNPFSRETAISCRSGRTDQLILLIYNLKGQLVKTHHLVPDNRDEQIITWDGTNAQGRVCSNGIYFARLKQHNQTVSCRKITLIK